jgi:hypothetical protein
LVAQAMSFISAHAPHDATAPIRIAAQASGTSRQSALWSASRLDRRPGGVSDMVTRLIETGAHLYRTTILCNKRIVG